MVAAAVARVLDRDAADVGDDDLSGADSIDRVLIADLVEEQLRPRYPRVALDDAVLATVPSVRALAEHAAARLSGGPG